MYESFFSPVKASLFSLPLSIICLPSLIASHSDHASFASPTPFVRNPNFYLGGGESFSVGGFFLRFGLCPRRICCSCAASLSTSAGRRVTYWREGPSLILWGPYSVAQKELLPNRCRSGSSRSSATPYLVRECYDVSFLPTHIMMVSLSPP